jgi:uncharacterized protein YoxC
MNVEQFDTLNMWLAILAIAAVVQILAMATLAILGYRLYANAARTLTDLEKRHVEPLTRRVNGVLDNVNEQVVRVRHVGDRVEQVVDGISGGISSAADSVKAAVMPGYAVTKGVMAAVSAFRSSGKKVRERRLLQDFDETRYVNEGGNDA